MDAQILVEYRNIDANHVEWAKALKELYVSGLRDYVKSHCPLGPVWSATGKTAGSAPTKAPAPGAPPPPRHPPPPASLFSSETTRHSSSAPKEGMSAVFQEINSGKPVTSGNSYSYNFLVFLLSMDLICSSHLWHFVIFLKV